MQQHPAVRLCHGMIRLLEQADSNDTTERDEVRRSLTLKLLQQFARSDIPITVWMHLVFETQVPLRLATAAASYVASASAVEDPAAILSFTALVSLLQKALSDGVLQLLSPAEQEEQQDPAAAAAAAAADPLSAAISEQLMRSGLHEHLPQMIMIIGREVPGLVREVQGVYRDSPAAVLQHLLPTSTSRGSGSSSSRPASGATPSSSSSSSAAAAAAAASSGSACVLGEGCICEPESPLLTLQTVLEAGRYLLATYSILDAVAGCQMCFRGAIAAAELSMSALRCINWQLGAAAQHSSHFEQLKTSATGLLVAVMSCADTVLVHMARDPAMVETPRDGWSYVQFMALACCYSCLLSLDGRIPSDGGSSTSRAGQAGSSSAQQQQQQQQDPFMSETQEEFHRRAWDVADREHCSLPALHLQLLSWLQLEPRLAVWAASTQNYDLSTYYPQQALQCIVSDLCEFRESATFDDVTFYDREEEVEAGAGDEQQQPQEQQEQQQQEGGGTSEPEGGADDLPTPRSLLVVQNLLLPALMYYWCASTLSAAKTCCFRLTCATQCGQAVQSLSMGLCVWHEERQWLQAQLQEAKEQQGPQQQQQQEPQQQQQEPQQQQQEPQQQQQEPQQQQGQQERRQACRELLELCEADGAVVQQLSAAQVPMLLDVICGVVQQLRLSTPVSAADAAAGDGAQRPSRCMCPCCVRRDHTHNVSEALRSLQQSLSHHLLALHVCMPLVCVEGTSNDAPGSCSICTAAATAADPSSSCWQPSSVRVVSAVEDAIRAAADAALAWPAAGSVPASTGVISALRLTNHVAAMVGGRRLLGESYSVSCALVDLAASQPVGSPLQQRLLSLCFSLLKASSLNSAGDAADSDAAADSAQQPSIAADSCWAAARTAGVMLAAAAAALAPDAVAGDSNNEGSAGAATSTPAAAAGGSSSSVAQQVKRSLPWLGLFGRCCERLGRELSETQQRLQPQQLQTLLEQWFEARLAKSESEWQEITGEQQQEGSAAPDLSLQRSRCIIRVLCEDLFAQTTRSCGAWLAHAGVQAQLQAAGFNIQPCTAALEQLVAVTEAAAGSAEAASAALPNLVTQLQAFASAASLLAYPQACNNSRCSNVSGPSETALVSGRSCVCAGCHGAFVTAHFCGRQCQRQAWPKHRSVCKALKAAAGGSGGGS